MTNIKTNTIFSKIPFTPSYKTKKETEDREISYWLEKLHIQGEKIRIDNNRREEQSRVDTKQQSFNEKFVNKKNNDLVQSGINESTKNIATKQETDTQIVNDLVKRSNRRVISISSQFPWDLFPNIIDVEESRVTFIFNQFLSSQSESVDIKNISNIFLESSLFFATLRVVSNTYAQNDIMIGKLNKTKAIIVQRIIEGLRTFSENNINTSNYDIDELISKIGEFHINHTN